MKKLLLCITLIFALQNTVAQPDGLIDETFNLKYLEVNNNTYYTPNNENITFRITENAGIFNIETNGIINGFSAEASFDDDTITLDNFAITLTECDTPNCYYEDLYFYEILTTVTLESKVFTLGYYEYPDGSKNLRLRDANYNLAYFNTEPPEEPNPLLFQTWYLYKVEVDLEDPVFYNGPNPPQLTINPDFTYTGIDGCLISGDFILGNDEGSYFLLQAQHYVRNTSDCPSGSNGLVMDELRDNLVTHCGMFTDSEGVDYFWYEAYGGFIKHFRNEVVLSVPENNLTDLKVFPNPATDKLHIQSPGTPINSVSVMDINGRVIYHPTFDLNEINVSRLKAGMYFLKIESPQGSTTRKFVKK